MTPLRLSRPLFLVLFLFLGMALRVPSADAGEEAIGLATAFYDADLSVELSGIVEEVCVKEGTTVEKGTVLLRFRREVETLDVERRKLVWENKTELESVKHRLTVVSNDLEATKNLYTGSKSVSREDMEKKNLEFELARSAVRQLEVSEKIEEIEYRMASENLKRREITAPVGGVVLKVHVDVGEHVQQHQPLVRLADSRRCYFSCNVPADKSAKVAPEAKLPVRFQLPGGIVKVSATVTFVSPLVDPASGLREIKLLFDNQDGKISPGIQGILELP